uniref:Uncharacterized protein n=1 Tax=Romanomermis culicivorax TaxID=13658 RepID=A0A915IN31_ROMCU
MSEHDQQQCAGGKMRLAQWEQRATNPGNSGTRMWEDPVLVARITQQVRATMATENGAARDDQPSALTASSLTAGDEVALGAEEKAENPKNLAR